MEELWAALDLNDTDEVLQPKAEQLCALSYQATFGTDSDTVMQLQAWIFGKQVSMLIDSGSTTSFIRDSFAAQFVGITPLPVPIRVRVADGAELHCQQQIVNCPWVSQGHEFQTTLKLLPLGSFDVILGMDWLKRYSPMHHVDWNKKTMTVTDKGKQVSLQGIQSAEL
jgi:hypothetical protein